MVSILVTGANGLLGSSILRLGSFEATGVTRSDCDLEDFAQVLELMNRERPDVVIHTGALVGGVEANNERPATFLASNVLQNLNVIEASRIAGVRRLLAFASTCAFPNSTTYPLEAGKLHDGEPHQSNFGYAYAKRLAEVHTRAVNKQYGLNYRTIIPTNLYGPGDNFDLKSGHVIPALIHKAFISKRDATEFRVWGSGSPLREFMFVDDLAQVIPRILESQKSNPLIVTPAHEISIGRLASLIAKEFQIEDLLVFDSSKPEGQLRKPSSPKDFESEFGKFPWTPIEDGIKQTIAWFTQNYPAVRGSSIL